MSLAIRLAPPPMPRAAGAQTGGSRAALAAVPARRRRVNALPGELALSAALLSLYVGCRGGARMLGTLEGIVSR